MVETDYEAKSAEIRRRLEADGWAMTYTCQDAGGLKTPSVWAVTLTRRGGTRAVTEYTKGAAHRHWKGYKSRLPWQSLPSIGTMTGFWDRYIKRGRPVQLSGKPLQLKDPEDCSEGMRDHQRKAFDEYAQLTEPDPPTLDEVMYSLVTDVSGVRYGQTFDEFCGEFGYSNDSIQARDAYDGCVREWQNLVRMGADLDTLQELFQDY